MPDRIGKNVKSTSFSMGILCMEGKCRTGKTPLQDLRAVEMWTAFTSWVIQACDESLTAIKR